MTRVISEKTEKDSLAAAVRQLLAEAGVAGIRIIGHPGAGKTELIEASLKKMAAPRRVGVIVVNPASAREAERLGALCSCVAHVDAASPTADAIWPIVSGWKLHTLDTVLIETAGGLAPLEDLGQDATVAVFAFSGGDDKAVEYQTLLQAASLVVLTKSDLEPMVKFDLNTFRRDVRSINPLADIHKLSSTTGAGIGDWLQWLEGVGWAKKRRRTAAEAECDTNNSFFG